VDGSGDEGERQAGLETTTISFLYDSNEPDKETGD
jgi:hypothetical protein